MPSRTFPSSSGGSCRLECAWPDCSTPFSPSPALRFRIAGRRNLQD